MISKNFKRLTQHVKICHINIIIRQISVSYDSVSQISFFKHSVSIMKNTFCNQFLPRNGTLPYFGDFWIDFFQFYLPIHKVISIIIVIFGLICNLFMMIVLTRKKMASPSNTFLIGISIADTTVLIIYLFTWIPLISYDHFSYEFIFWSIALLTPYLIFR